MQIKNFFKKNYYANKIALVTGGSKGLGFILAKQLLQNQCKVYICARDEAELAEARSELNSPDLYTVVCDVSSRDAVDQMMKEILDTHGQIDFIFNNAGIITVGPMESFTEQRYKDCMDVMYWGIVNTTLSATPHMKERKSGHIINITSVGGLISVPHLLPYSAAKFAAVGFSEGCAAELRKDNVFVTTIVPGLMRTGSYVNALFPKDKKAEFKLFSFMSSLPLITLNPEKAARRILAATEKKRVLKILGLQTHAAVEFHHFFPGTTVKLFGLATSLLPYSETKKFEDGKSITERYQDAEIPGVRRIGEIAQEKYQPIA
jgi:short-subunit dehydrogenase